MRWFAEYRRSLRTLVRRPGFALLTILTIGLGIAANTAMFGVIRAVLLRPLPYADPGQLVAIESRAPTGFLVSLSIPNFKDWQERNRSFATFGGAAGWHVTLTGRGPAEVLSAQAIIGEFFETLRPATALGRLIPAAETEPGADGVAVLGYGYWQRVFGGDPNVLGTVLRLDGRPYTIVGVTDEGFGWPTLGTDLYLPMGTIPDLPWSDRNSGFGTRGIARLAAGATLADGQADLARVGREMREAFGEQTAVPEARGFEEFFLGDIRPHLWVLMAGVGCILLIGISNVASLQLTRAEEQRRELAVRTALGATRADLARHLIRESLVLSLIGGGFGVLLAWFGTRAIIPFLPQGIPTLVLSRIGVDVPVLLFAFGLTLVSCLLVGLVPALRTANVQPAEEVRGSAGSTTGRGRVRRFLVAAEVATALVLLIGAALLITTFENLRSVDKGFEADGLLTARLQLPEETYRNEASWIDLMERLRTDLSALPGASQTAVSLLLPLSDRSWERRVRVEGVKEETPPSVLFGVVSPEYFSVLDVPVLEGRSFTAADRNGELPVAVVDERLAEHFWPTGSAIGKRINVGENRLRPDGTREPVFRTVIGVSKNVRHYELETPSRMQAYIPYRQAEGLWGIEMYAMVKTTVPPTDLATPLRNVVAGMDPGIAVSDIRPLQDYVDGALGPSRAMGRLFGAFSGVAALLAALGVFGVFSYAVTQRRREIGIRMALGASTQRVLRSILRDAVTTAASGILVGLLAALLLGRYVRSLLFGITTTAPGAYLAMAVAILGVAMLAAVLPARTASRVDPLRALKEE